MILGCEQDRAIKFDAPLVVEVAPVKCPDVDRATEAEFNRVTPRPPGPLTKDDVRKWIDALEESEVRKNAHGRQVIRELRQCREQQVATAGTS